jgi:hypothetical protein
MVVMETEARSEPRSKPEQVEAMKRTALLSIAAAAALVALKLGAGMAIGSLGLISAGIESTGDVVTGGERRRTRRRAQPGGPEPDRGGLPQGSGRRRAVSGHVDGERLMAVAIPRALVEQHLPGR